MWIPMVGENPSKFQVTICFLHKNKNKVDLFSLGMCGLFIRQSPKNHKVQLNQKKKKKQDPFLKKTPLSLAQFPEMPVKYSKENF